MESTDTAIIDDSKFPLTTQKGLSPKDQALIDSINLDDLREAVQLGEQLTDEQKQILSELETKEQIRKAAKSKPSGESDGQVDADSKPKETGH